MITASSVTQAQEMMRVEPNLIVLGTLAPAGQAFSMHDWLRQHPRYRDIPLMVIDARYEERSIKGWRRFEGMQMDADEYRIQANRASFAGSPNPEPAGRSN